MIERIKENEKILDEFSLIIEKIAKDITELEEKKDDLAKLNKYYGSKNWFKDKEKLEKGKIVGIKAGVLSEDAVWNLLTIINELQERLNNIKKEIYDNKKESR